MKSFSRWLGLLLIFSLVGASAEPSNGALERPKTSKPPVVMMSVLDTPHKARVNGVEVVAYELLVTNNETTDCKLLTLDCLSDGKVVKSYPGAELPAMSRRVAWDGSRLSSPVLAPGQSAVIFMWLEGSPVVESLNHRLTIDLGDGLFALEGVETPVITSEPIVVGLPFSKAGRWAAIGAPSNVAGHRRAVMFLNGRPWLSQRFAIDWIMLGPDGLASRGDGSRNEDHYCYGVEAIAVADGVIADTYDKIPDQKPSPTERSVPITTETIGGNWVALKLAEGQYGMYAHLIPGSLRVKKGDRVKRGDVIGLVGNTGNSTAPHLHFHVSTTPNWTKSKGLPYQIDSFRTVGSIKDSVKQPEGFEFIPDPTGGQTHTNDLLKEDEVIEVSAKR